MPGLIERASRGLAQRTSRRSFLGRVGKTLVAMAGGSFVVAALDPTRAEAYHLCAHIFTTGSCPHPYFPETRIDRFGYPVHPVHGFPVDDRGDAYVSRTQTRRKICDEVVPERFPFTKPTVLEGTWARCCKGRIRRVVDCCSRSATRINGDASLIGYCHGGRKVFCITYLETEIPC